MEKQPEAEAAIRAFVTVRARQLEAQNPGYLVKVVSGGESPRSTTPRITGIFSL